ncbi:hypothetical protein MHYP_G00144440 [Metynnis hypsauchen]
MLVIFGILLMFTEAGVGLLSMNPVCRFDQSDPCYGAVGRPLYLQLPSEDELKLKKIISGTSYIFRFKNKTITQKHSDPRWQFVTDNSTMIISSAEKRDSGRYTLETFDSGGIYRGVYHPQLVIEDVVSSVTVTDSCLSIEKRKVYCSSDGDNVQYSWTFPPTHQPLLLGKEAVGSVTCYAQNRVSRGNKTIEIQKCPGLLSMNPDCRFTQSGPCYGAVGRPLYLHLSSEDDLILKKRDGETTEHLVFKCKHQSIRLNPLDPRWQFITTNRIMIISSAEKRDSGRYTLETFDSAGMSKGVYHLQLVIEAVVSSVQVKDNCFSNEKRTLTCSSDGDNLQFSWFFSGITLAHQLADGDRTLLLDKDKVGNVICYVQNHVSRGHKTIELHQCPETTTHIMSTTVAPVSAVTRRAQSTHLNTGFMVFVSVWLFEVIVLLSLLVGAFYIYTRIYKKQRAAESNEHEVEEVL